MADSEMQVLELRRAGVSFVAIAERLDLPGGAAEARALYDSSFTADDLRFSSDLEASRLDRMHTALWPRAVKGDELAVDRVLRISERREKLTGPPKTNLHELRHAFDASVSESAEIRPVDAALVEAGRKIADRVDEALAYGEGQEVTKALYLLPHLNNVLRELLATPASRIAAGVVVDDPNKGGKLAQLRSVKGKRTA